MTLKQLQKKYPKFLYSNYSYKISGENLKISFLFKIEPGIIFKPELIIKNIPTKFDLNGLDNLVFNLGLIEMISYWKATCSPVIEIECGNIDEEQIKFWKFIILNGMGQFFFENKIKPFSPKIVSFKKDKLEIDKKIKKDNYLIPIGGGKDSIVTLELLKKEYKFNCFSLNPTVAAKKVMKVGGCKKPIIVNRKIDKNLLSLNRKGFLNGHTPFSAYLAFLTVLTAKIFDYKYIALSNEKSSNEGNLKYYGKNINHQWSKSYEFEKSFNKYSKKYLSKEIKYFSFLRPFYELQIAELFSKYPKYFSSFLSCNEAHKTYSGKRKPKGEWCGQCSKCLFTYIILYPYLERKDLIKIFGKDLFKNKRLIIILQQLIGEKGFKPFECVGTHNESLTALYLNLKKNKFLEDDSQPILLKYFKNKILPKYPGLDFLKEFV
ncbi:MAG: hypothetical protein ABID67_01285 [Candidatus Nealsonbacteria bacterium]